jgi:chemotaxis protein MotB
LHVTDTLIGHGVPPQRLVLAGYSEYDPVASNGSEAGRQKNRRIEIILEPYVEEKLVAGLLETKSPAPAAAPGKAGTKPAAAGKLAPVAKPAATKK